MIGAALTCLSTEAGAGDIAVAGFVADAGVPVGQAEVLLVNAANGVIEQSTSTDVKGRFHFTVEPGVFKVGAFKREHTTAWTRKVEVQQQDVSLHIELTPRVFLDGATDSSEPDCD